MAEHTKSLHSAEKLPRSLPAISWAAVEVIAATVAFSESREKGEWPVTLEMAINKAKHHGNTFQ